MTQEARKKRGVRISRTVMIVLLSLLLNYAGRSFTISHNVPFWFDTFGVLVSSYALGPVSGAIIGFTSNAMIAFTSPESLVYGLVSAFVGMTAGIAARRGGFRSFFSSTSYGAFLALGTSIFSTILNLIFHNGMTTNSWGDAVVRFCSSFGMWKWLSSFVGEGYLEFVDKVTMVTAFWAGLEIFHRIKNKGKSDGAIRAGVLLAAIVIPVLLAAPGLGLPVQAKIRNESNVNFESYSRTVYDASKGLVSGHATDVTAAGDGSLWIGSYAGLYRYDGRTFEPRSQSQIKSVNSLYTDDDGRLWVGTNDSGLALIVNDKVADVADTSSGLCSDSVRSIAQASDGTYYIGTSDYVERIGLSNGIHVVGELKDVTFAKSLSADDDGNVAAACEDGTLFLIREGEITDRITDPDSGFSAVSFDEEGHLFAGTEDGRLFQYVVRSGKLKWEKTYELDVNTVINDADSLEDGSLLILTDQGLFRLQNGILSRVDTGDFTHSLQQMAVDYQGNIWIASTRDGLLELSDSAFRDVFGLCGVPAHLVNACIRWQGHLYAGCDDGLIILDEDHRRQVENDLTKMLDGTRVRYFAEGPEGRLYIATYGKGILYTDPDGTIGTVSGGKNPGDRVRTLMTASDGTIVASGERGISFIREGKAENLISYGGDFGNAAALCFSETSDGRILAGTDGNGLFILKDGKIVEHFTRKDGFGSDVILKIVHLKAPNVWLFVTSNSICVWQAGVIRTISSFPYSNNYDILQSGSRLFVTGSAGIYVTTSSALIGDEASEAFLVGAANRFDASLTVNSENESSDGALLLCTGNGLVSVDTSKIALSGRSIRMKVRNLHAGNAVIPAEDGIIPTLSRDSGSIAIEAEMVNYSVYMPPIRYRLKGYEDEWHSAEPSDLANIVYGQLPAGQYTFQLELLDRGTGKAAEESDFAFCVKESLEDTTGFKIYFIVTTIGFAAWLAWFITRAAMQKRAAEGEREVEQARVRVAMGNKAIISIARALYAKDKRTGQHSYNVAYYASKLGKAYGFSEKECQNLHKAALLHDIGKIAIPDAILNKPGRLTEEEYAIMKTHTTIGAEILSGFTLIDHVSEGAKYHHERYDGKGYPDGIAGTDIPLYGRIIAVADAYDAMTANRVYRAKQDISFAADQIRKGRGTQFDPHLADLFLDLMEKGEVNPDDVQKMYEDRDPEEDIV